MTSEALERSKAELEQDIDDFMRGGEATGVAPPSTRRRARPKKAKTARAASAKKLRAKAKARAPKRKAKSKAKTKTRVKKAKRSPARKRKAAATRRAKSKKKSKKMPRRTARRATTATERMSTPITVNPLIVVLDAVAEAPASGRFGPEKVFIYPLWQKVGRKIKMSLAEFKRWLVDQNRERTLDLARADLVGAMDPTLVRESEIVDLGSAFHFVIDRSARNRRW